jgi:RimJ/RimL family protein N-acetyltransferase
LEHLRPWLTWTVHEPLSSADRLTWVRTQRGHFDLGSDYCFGAFSKDESALLGMGLLRLASSVDEREVGYWLHADQLGKGLATELVAALVRVSFEIEELDALEIRTFPHNLASARVAERLGFGGPVLDMLAYPMPDGDKRDLHVYALSRVQYATSPARDVAIEAYDVLERRIL